MMMTRRKKKSPKPELSARAKKPFIEHFNELRRRVFFVALSVIGWSAAAYGVEHQIIDVLLKPAHGQEFIYTSPIGGMNFLLRVCLYVGVAVSIPVIVYQFLRYIEPLMRRSSSRFIFYGSLASGILAVAGILFGYFFGLPAALKFLLHQFITQQVQPLLTVDAYLTFVAVYMLGAALMFQIPLIVLFIHRIKPLTPQALFRKERWVILIAVVLSMIMNPTPRLFDQLFIAGPIILSYQLAIALIWWSNARHKHGKLGKVAALRDKDEEQRSERLAKAQALKQSWLVAAEIADEPIVTSTPNTFNQAAMAAAADEPVTVAARPRPRSLPLHGSYVRREVGQPATRVRIIQ